MNGIKRIRKLFWLSVACFAIMASTALIMPFASSAASTQGRMPLLVVGGLFWLSAAIGYILVIIANVKRRKFIAGKTNDEVNMNCRCGLLTFFGNIPAAVFDTILIAAIAVGIVAAFTKLWDTYLPYILLFLLLLSLNLHCMFNGRIYKATKYKRTRRGNNNE